MQRQFLSNAAVAIVIALVVGVFHQSHWLVRLENSAMDTMMEFNKGLPRMLGADAVSSPQFTFLDIDDASFRDWGEPFHVPRDKILSLIRFAAEGKARLIVLDIDLSRAGIDARNDRLLADYLVQYGTEQPPPLILVRTFYSGNSSDRQWVNIRPSYLDRFEFSESVYWAQPLFRATLWDGVIRHWHLVKFGCLNGQLVLVPATQLIAAALLSEGSYSPGGQYTNVNSLRLESCSGEGSLSGPGGAGEDTPAAEAELGQRLVYTLPWKSPAPDLLTVPAMLVTESAHDLAHDLVQGRVVIIGASFADSRDIHRTPIGEMPGALIIANAIKSLSVYGQVRPLPVWALWAVKLSMILLAAWAFSRFTSLIAVCVAGALVIGALVPVSYYFFKFGYWIDFAIPLFAMALHRAVAEYRASHGHPGDGGARPGTVSA